MDNNPASDWPVWLKVSLWLALLGFSAVFALSSISELPLLDFALESLRHHVPPEKAIYSPVAYLVLVTVVVALEARKPVRTQAILSVSFYQDLLWYSVRLLGLFFFLAIYSESLKLFYEQHLSFLTLNFAGDWHPALRFTVALLVIDFLRWLSHLIRHKVPFFWAFHAVHHSQRELNMFTDARVHPVDLMISSTIKFIPMFMFQNAFLVFMAWSVWETVYPKFYHANVKLNLGPLRYILVTPQSHRLHHSKEPQHSDRNFGFIFCIWDRLFGTQWKDCEDYPETGINDSSFPLESSGGLASMFANLCLQLIYPFKEIYYRCRQFVTARMP